MQSRDKVELEEHAASTQRSLDYKTFLAEMDRKEDCKNKYYGEYFSNTMGSYARAGKYHKCSHTFFGAKRSPEDQKQCAEEVFTKYQQCVNNPSILARAKSIVKAKLK